MPAYRSPAEGEIRDAVVARLREIRPQARIIHEIACAVYGPNRIDLIAVSPAEIIAVEVKSAKDKLDRLPAQVASMLRMSHHTIAAIHEKFLVEQKTNEWSAHYERDGVLYVRREPDQCQGAVTWVFPERWRAIKPKVSGGYDSTASWRQPRLALQEALPSGALNMLWADELRDLCHGLHISVGKRTPRDECLRALRWHATGQEITKAICRTLRQRPCTEADDPIEEAVAA